MVLRVLEGPLALQGELVCRGPVVRLGAKPGPGGVDLSAYRGLDDRQAVISAYDGATVSVAPVGTNQVRLAAHANVDWSEILPLRKPAYLTDGSAFHLGPVGRGVTIEFVECRRLGVWEQQNIVSDGSDISPDVQPSDVKELRTNRRVPVWFWAGTVALGLGISVAALLSVIGIREFQKLGPQDEGTEYYEVATTETETNVQLLEGFAQAWAAFIQNPNAEYARRKEFQDEEHWDSTLLNWTTRSAQQHIRAKAYWARLEAITDDYAFVVKELRDAKMPEVFAAIPYQESRYRAEAQSPVCAKGYWQFMPEVARRYSLPVANCVLRGVKDQTFTPTRLTPPPGVLKNAPYVRDESCIITSCNPDARTDLAESTRAAIEALREPLEDTVLADSGAVLQITIASHNAGYDDERFDGNKSRPSNLKPAYQRWLREKKLEYDSTFLGKQILCPDAAFNNGDKCGSLLHRETQHYAYTIIAQHFVAVCYYATNYGDRPEFAPWRDFARGNGYCSEINVPSSQEVRKWM